MTSPTQRTLKMLRDDGWHCWVVEHWNPHARRRVDLFNLWDILAIKGPETLAAQVTSGSGVSARLKKIEAGDYIDACREAGWRLEVHGWRKVKVKRGGKATKWACRIVDVS